MSKKSKKSKKLDGSCFTCYTIIMNAFSGYISGNTVVTDRNVGHYNGRKVIITILDEKQNQSSVSAKKVSDMKSLFGILPSNIDLDKIKDERLGL